MIESVTLPSIHTNGQYGKANEPHENNNNQSDIRLKFPFQIQPVDPVINQNLLRDFTGEKDGFVQVGPKRFLFPGTFKKHAEHFYNFKARADDIWIATYPRSGTTWTQELTWMIANDLDYDGAQRDFLTKRSPFFEFCVFMHDKTKQIFIDEHDGNVTNQDTIRAISVPGYEFIPNMVGKRFIKTHLPFSLMPPSVMNERAKIIYVARNPKDVIVSYYHLSRLYRTTGYTNDFATFWDYFEKDLVAWSPYWEHIKEGWANRNESNVLFMFYEEMNKDLPATIRKVAKFLNKSMNDDQVSKLADYLSIENFRNNPAVNQHELREIGILNATEPAFVRNGKSTLNGWQKEYTADIVSRVESWVAKNLADTTLRFPNFK